LPAERIHYLDWLRLGAVLAVVVYHALLPFGSVGPWSVQNAEQSDALALLSALLPFAFPVFFLLAGASVHFALQIRTVGGLLAERTMRLLVPLLVGSAVLIPICGYIIAVHNGTSSGSILEYLAAYPATVLDNLSAVGFRPLAFSVVAMHLWFLAWLFLFCLIAAPLFAFLSTTRGHLVIDWLARCARWRGGTLLFTIPLTLIALPLFGISSPAGWDWAAFGLWGGTFVGGYLMFSDERIAMAVRRDLLPALAAAILGVGGLAATGFTGSIFEGGAHTYDATYVVLVSIHSLAAWGVAISVLSAAMRVGFMRRPLARVATEAALPTYVLHLPIVIAISIVVVGLPLGLLPKALINVGLGLATTLLVVAVATRIPVVRDLLGLRPRRSTAVAATFVPPTPVAGGSRASAMRGGRCS
jgi:peptidoglycan/LPS O-acetylase OafA/YrhL